MNIHDPHTNITPGGALVLVLLALAAVAFVALSVYAGISA